MIKRNRAVAIHHPTVTPSHLLLAKKISMFLRQIKSGPKSSVARYDIFLTLARLDLEEKSTRHLQSLLEGFKMLVPPPNPRK